MNGKKSVLFLLIVAVIAAITYRFWHYPAQQAALTLYGNVDIRSVNLAFRVPGRLIELTVDEGDQVQPGQLLARLDDEPYRHAQQQAVANVAAATAQLALLQAGYRTEEIAQARAQVEQLLAAFNYADSFFNRQQQLSAHRAVSANELEDARTLRNQAQATLQAAKERLAQFVAGNRPEQIAVGKANLAQAQAALAQAELQLQDTRLLASSAGIVLTRAVEPGTQLSVANTVFTLSLPQPVWVRAYVAQRDLDQAVPGRQVEIYRDGRPDQPYQGRIGFVSPSAEFTPKSVETQDLRSDLVFRLRIVVTDADDGLRQGMPVTIRFTQPDNSSQR
ncbi:secretion protein HlyD [Serratia microhaemolytica]|uniref:secretion protein HlyD n=1 Tax=Serratia microhaemolytica TaxID=2675110 RepID=UPI000FDD2425|nr:secretion protein HlyD [Serratia microhaemolytica]